MSRLIDMLEIVCIVLLSTCVMSCSVLQGRRVLKMDSVQVNNSLHSKKWDVDSLGTSFHSLTVFDSTNSTYMVEIFPSGKFSFSVQDGFTGMAKKIVLRGAIKRSFKSMDSLENALHVKSSGQLTDRNKIKLSVSSKTVEKSAAAWGWIAVPVLLTLLVLCLLKSNLF